MYHRHAHSLSIMFHACTNHPMVLVIMEPLQRTRDIYAWLQPLDPIPTTEPYIIIHTFTGLPATNKNIKNTQTHNTHTHTDTLC